MTLLIISVLENIVVDAEEIDSPRGGLSRGDKDALSQHHHDHHQDHQRRHHLCCHHIHCQLLSSLRVGVFLPVILDVIIATVNGQWP